MVSFLLATSQLLLPFKFLNFINHPSGLKILQSCNGLLLCSSFRDRGFKHNYYVYNPTTKQFVTLPPPAKKNTLIVSGVSLAFDPTKSPHYKVVCVREPDQWLGLRDDPESSYVNQQIEIFSSQTQSCRLSGNPFIAEVNTGFKGGVFCNGAIHWLTGWGTTSPYFNVEEEKLRQLPMPPFPNDWEDLRRTYLHPSDLNYYVFSVLCIVREANDEESYIVLHIPDKAIQYNLKDDSFKKMCDLEPDENNYRGSPTLISLTYFWAEQFIQTLSSI
ncbi:hypothetical protein REPUB_Repub08aG0009500 [Reevesia pubescens]